MNKLSQISITQLFDKALKYIINVLVIYIIIILVLSLGKTIYTIKILFEENSTGLNLSHIITDILSFLVMIELFRSFIEYFKAKRIRLHSMIDPAIIFIVRELIIQLYTHQKLESSALISFGVLLLCLGIIRTLALVISPKN